MLGNSAWKPTCPKWVMYTRSKDKVLLVPLGDVDLNLLMRLASEVEETLPFVRCTVSSFQLELPKDAYNPHRRQYNSDIIMKLYRGRFRNRTLMVTEVDLYSPGLNFIFGQAEYPGLLALISLARLNPSFYGKSYDKVLFIDRAVKEAVHEICHTYGLSHCSNPICVMHFSNSIIDTDLKSKVPCRICLAKLEKILEIMS